MFEADANSVGKSEMRANGKRKRRSGRNGGGVRIGRDGKTYYKLKPLTADQTKLVRDMVAMGHPQLSIARAIGRSLGGTQLILRRMKLRTVRSALKDAKNERRRASIEARLKAEHEARNASK